MVAAKCELGTEICRCQRQSVVIIQYRMEHIHLGANVQDLPNMNFPTVHLPQSVRSPPSMSTSLFLFLPHPGHKYFLSVSYWHRSKSRLWHQNSSLIPFPKFLAFCKCRTINIWKIWRCIPTEPFLYGTFIIYQGDLHVCSVNNKYSKVNMQITRQSITSFEKTPSQLFFNRTDKSHCLPDPFYFLTIIEYSIVFLCWCTYLSSGFVEHQILVQIMFKWYFCTRLTLFYLLACWLAMIGWLYYGN